MESLPLVPGFNFSDPTKQSFKIVETLKYKNGYLLPTPYPTMGIGPERLRPSQLTQKDLDDLANFHPILTYGKAKQAAPSTFVPAHVALDKKVLRFYGYFKQTVHESQAETYRVRHIVLFYFLEDDTITITEPHRTNSGLPQGKLLKRHRLPKNDMGEFYHWSDLNIAMNFSIYGRVYRLTNCDKFTKDFLESEGIVLNDCEADPVDPYLKEREVRETQKDFKTPSSYDARRQNLENDRKVLRFYAVWDDRGEMYGDCRFFCVNYYLGDDTMEVTEVHQPNDGYDPFSVLIRRGKIPKTFAHVPRNFPTVCMEFTANEIKEYFRPKDFRIGNTLVILGRKFLLYDCDNFTKVWYHENFDINDFTPVDVSIRPPEVAKMEIPPYNGFGSLDDSMMMMRSFMPNRPKTNLPKLVDYGTKTLRYGAVLQSPIPEDATRKFIIIYHLADDTITIQEIGLKNSGFPRQKFLQKTRVMKPGSREEAPVYYGPTDFAPCQTVTICGHRFCIYEVDLFVIKFMEANRDQFPAELITRWQEQMKLIGNSKTPELAQQQSD